MLNLERYTDGFFQVNANNGFLPLRDPLKTLPKKYSELQKIIDFLPRQTDDGLMGILGVEGAIEAKISQLTNFIDEVKTEKDPFILQALFRTYAFLTAAYTLSPAHFHFLKEGKYGKANQFVPAQLAMPFCAVAEKLKVFPWLDYHYAYSLGNYVKIDPKGGWNWENLEMAVKFSGMPDERGFIMLHVDINQHSPKLVGAIMESLQQINHKNNQQLNEALEQAYLAMKAVNERRQLMWQASRWKHYNDFRVFIMGVKGNEEIFGDGVIYHGVDEKPRQYRGQTGAQDNIIPTMDIFSGVIHHYPENELTHYLMDLRSYRPVCIQNFFEDLQNEMHQIHPKGLMGWLNENKNTSGLVWLAGIIEEIYYFRNGHWQFVQKYIMQNTAYSKATGGTPIISWIPNQIRAVLTALGQCLSHIPTNNTSTLYKNIVKGYPSKEKLLNRQLKMLHEPDYDAKKVFDLNKTLKLEDEQSSSK